MNQTQPNRALRRAAAKQRPSKVHMIAEPSYIDKWRIFDATERIVLALEHGEVTAENGKPIFMGINGDICYVVPALEGWVMFWQHAHKKLGLLLDTAAPFDAIRKRLQHDVVLTERMVANARQALTQQRIYYDTLDRDGLASIANDVRIKLYLEVKQNA